MVDTNGLALLSVHGMMIYSSASGVELAKTMSLIYKPLLPAC